MHVPGTSPAGVDVQDYVDIGVTNMAVATGLTLQDGQTYYVTVRGELSLVVGSYCGQRMWSLISHCGQSVWSVTVVIHCHLSLWSHCGQ